MMTYLLDSKDLSDTPMQFLTNVFGTSLKSGNSAEIVQWMVLELDIRQVFADPLSSYNGNFSIDLRIRAPRICIN